MPKPVYVRVSDLRGIQRLANPATVGLTDLVEAMHHTVLRTPGILVVAVTSALGQRRHASLNLGLPEAQRWVGYGMGHLDLLSRVAVYEQIRDWLTLPTRR
jgi:hypothetical protein